VRDTFWRLEELAKVHRGFFTTLEAAASGLSRRVLSHHAASGMVERVAYGIYRLRSFPPQPFEELAVAALWAGGEAVLSHQSALVVHGLADTAPPLIHLTLPGPFGRTREGVVVHLRPLDQSERLVVDGLPVTSVERTLADVAGPAREGGADVEGGMLGAAQGGRPRRPTRERVPYEVREPGGDDAGSGPVAGQGLPAFHDSFVGRERDFLAVGRLLGAARLVTLTGPPGVGKTRLATRLAELLADEFCDGTWFVDLASVAEPGLVTQSVAEAVSATEHPGRSLEDDLVAHLSPRRGLVVLDNCEHLVAACAGLAEVLSAGCPQVTILATSQEPLAVPGERVHAVAPLGLGDQGTSSVPEAIRLFFDRAEATGAKLASTVETRSLVGEICRRLDGLPLAIELAAGRTVSLSVAEIAGQLDDRFAVLGGGRRTAGRRHETLAAALDWSYGLLSPPEAALLMRLSVFAGGAALAAIEEVCSGEPVPAGEVADLLGVLVARSLVAEDNGPEGPRYRLLESVRHYAARRLGDAGGTSGIRLRHARWCVRFAEQAEAALTGAAQQATLQQLRLEAENLRAATDRTVADGWADEAVRIVGALAIFWRVTGSFGEWRQRVRQILPLLDAVDEPVRAKGAWSAGFMGIMLGAYGAATPFLENALSLYEHLEDISGRARSVLLLGNCELTEGSRSEALRLHQRSAALASHVGDEWCLTLALLGCGTIRVHDGDLYAACDLLEEAVCRARRSGDRQVLGMGLSLLGHVHREQGDYDRAAAVLAESLAMAAQVSDRWGKSVALFELGWLSIGAGDYGRAGELLSESLAAARQSGSVDVEFDALCGLASVAEVGGDLSKAEALFEQARSVAGAAGDENGEATAGLGRVASARGDFDRATILLETALGGAEGAALKEPIAAAVYDLATLARHRGQARRAVELHHQALRLRHDLGARPQIAQSLEALAGLAVANGGCARAARLYGVASALRQAHGHARAPLEDSGYEADIAVLRSQLSVEKLEAAWDEGARMSLLEAYSYATKRRRDRPAGGWDSLTPAEAQVITLVNDGHNNAEIAAALFLSVNTVKTHLSHIYAKLGVSDRRELAAANLQLAPEPTSRDSTLRTS